ncbi:DUF835 domain-containing protein [Candidatus Woesearchaeota archaeon]|nr:DUF835 domain-containing protein [Candidatus Woesearchaeota archaeon]
MSSSLIITRADSLQSRISSVLKGYKGVPIVYVSLNKAKKAMEKALKDTGINIEKICFIDCVSSGKDENDVLYMKPDDLAMLGYSIRAFLKRIRKKKVLVIDALSTFLIYNGHDKVAAFVRDAVEYSSRNDAFLIAFSPKTKGEELLSRIFNFFDEVYKR